MPVEGMEKRANCPDCDKRIKLMYRNGKWRWAAHKNKQDVACYPDVK